ncbi:MAG: hypothetical protein GX640_23660 [Fibrobacter sp.]|nr:hypothetical protein [Fibrobacter sp.]
MKLRNILLAAGSAYFLLISSVSATQPDSVKAVSTSSNKTAGTVRNAENDTLVVNARLIEIFGSFPSNDLYNYVYIMKYRIISVTKGDYSEKEILVGHYNPKIARNLIKDKMASFVKGDVSSFNVGDKHKLELITPIERVWKDQPIEDSYEDSDAPKYFALRCDIIK